MALEMIVSPFLGVVFDKLSSLITRESRLQLGIKKDLKKLSKTLSRIQNVLVDADLKQINDQQVRDWLTDLKDAAYDAEDVLDECEYEGLQQESDVVDTNWIKQVSTSLSACFNFKKIVFRHKMGKKIREVIERFDEIDAERLKFQLIPGVGVTRVDGFGLGQETSHLLTEPIICGRVEEKESIIQILLNNSGSPKTLSLCPILGIGGLGKTTLAQLTYGDERVVNCFDTRIWICVSDDFSVKLITRMIIDHLSGKKCDLTDLSAMQNLLRNLLRERNFLLVLDDVWDNSQENWNAIIMSLLACGAKGSSIIVTTRLPTVVDSIIALSSSCIINPTCNLECLSEYDSWSLFEHWALGVVDRKNENLVGIGKVVVAKCKGIPLAIKAVGSLLKSKREEFWKLVRDNEIWRLEEHGEDTILPALRLSYYHLPPLYRRCFAYCSIYPKDCFIKKEHLIHGWMANGFIHSRRGMEVEDIGDEIFNGLLQRSFFQDKHEDEFRNAVTCKMHDLVHDLACSVAKTECWRMETSEMVDVSQRIRHVSVTCKSPFSSDILSSLVKSNPYIRTLMFFVYGGTNLSGLGLFVSHPGIKHLRMLDLGGLWNLKSVPPWICYLRQLEYLDLGGTGITELPEFVCGLTNLRVLSLGKNGRLSVLPSLIGRLKSLRYLDLSETSIKELPESICTLTNLQTLKLWSCGKLERFPRNLKNIKSLRNLIINYDTRMKLLISHMPAGIGELTRLEKLKIFVVNNASESAAGIQELGRLDQLKGNLTIQDIKNLLDPIEAKEAKMMNKDKLSHLFLEWGSSEVAEGNEEEEKKISYQVLESLQPHLNLQMLRISDYPGVELPGWVGNCALTLPNLRKLELDLMPNAAHYLHQLPPNLVTLWIVGCPKLKLHPELRFPSSIKQLSVGAYNDPTMNSVQALPHLSQLQINRYSCNQQGRVIGERIRNLTCLRDLWIANCWSVKTLLPQLQNLRKSLTELRFNWCEDLDCITEEGVLNLASLRTLLFRGCSGLTSLSDSPTSLRHLRSLTRLDLVNCQKLDLSAIEFHHLVSLQTLVLQDLHQLTTVPDGIQRVTTLHNLQIWDCKNLKMLPQWLEKKLPLSLWYLQILRCHSELHRRCEMDKGEDWHIISHLKVDNIE